MCGIVGVVQNGIRAEQWPVRLKAMTDTLAHRGPDDAGWWFDAESGIGLGHRRLSIIALSSSGHQPMTSASGNYVITYNGEVYNFAALRTTLESLGHRFRGRSATEVLLAAVEQWGVEAALKRFVGMYALGLWDRSERVLYLARDRMGEQPLYYGWHGSAFMFGSELKALRVHPAWQGEIDRGAVTLFMRHSYVPAPYCIYRGMHKLPPGTYLALPLSGATPGCCPAPMTYWSLRRVVEAGKQVPFDGTDGEAADELEQLLREAVAGQMVSDVPLGAFLSGGIDSSTIVALMQVQSTRPVKTFTIGFHEAAYNEAEQAQAVAEYLGTEHTTLYVTPQQAMEVIPHLPTLYDEPFSDASQIPTFLVSEMTRQHVTVSLSGDAGDELFGGYNRYAWGRLIWRRIGWLPTRLRRWAAAGLRLLPPQTWTSLFDLFGPILPSKVRVRIAGDKIYKLADVLAVDSPHEMYGSLVSHWRAPA